MSADEIPCDWSELEQSALWGSTSAERTVAFALLSDLHRKRREAIWMIEFGPALGSMVERVRETLALLDDPSAGSSDGP